MTPLVPPTDASPRMHTVLRGGVAWAASLAAVAVIASSPRLRSLCAPLALVVPAGLIAAGVVAAVLHRVRGSTLPRPWRPWRPWLDALALPLAVAVAFIPVLGAWTATRTHGALIGGLLPYSDAGDYLAGAQRLLSEGSLDAWNCRRPLNATLLAVRLALAHGSLRGALLMQCTLLATAAWLGARAVADSLGRAGGLVVLGGILVFGGIFSPTTMSECLGLTLGSLGLAVLWQGAAGGSRWLVAAGCTLMTAALSARSGPFGVLPMLGVWASVRPGASLRARWDRAGMVAAVGGITAGFTVNHLVLRVYGGVRAGGQANFAYTLYGLAAGGLGWERAFQDFPRLQGMADAEAGAYVYARALERIRSHPSDLLLGLWRNIACAVDAITDNASGGVLAHHPGAQWTVALTGLAGLGWATARTLRGASSDRTGSLSVAAWVGVLVSVPVIYMDGRERVFAAAFPLVVAWAATLLTRTSQDVSSATALRRARPAVALGGLLLAASLLGVLVVRTRPATAVPVPRCRPEEVAIVLDARVLPTLTLTAAGNSLAPTESVGDFRRGMYRDPNLGTNGLTPALAPLAAGTSLSAGYNRVLHRMEYMASSTGLRPGVPLCALPQSQGSRRVLVVQP